MKHSSHFLSNKAAQIRSDVLKMIHKAGTGHTGGSLSSVDILVALYYEVLNVNPKDPVWLDRDRFILSKGHSCEGLYCVLADLGFFAKHELDTFSGYMSLLTGHPTRKIPGVEVNTGSLGHGLSVGVGMALGSRMDHKPNRIFVVLGDGELAEGSVWEAAMAAGSYGLDNLVAIIDRNRLQISGHTEDVMKLEPLVSRWESFGWSTKEVDGHKIPALVESLQTAPYTPGRPSLLIANTVKGYGVSFMQNNPSWHHRVPNDQELKRALCELEGGDPACL